MCTGSFLVPAVWCLVLKQSFKPHHFCNLCFFSCDTRRRSPVHRGSHDSVSRLAPCKYVPPRASPWVCCSLPLASFVFHLVGLSSDFTARCFFDALSLSPFLSVSPTRRCLPPPASCSSGGLLRLWRYDAVSAPFPVMFGVLCG